MQPYKPLVYQSSDMGCSGDDSFYINLSQLMKCSVMGCTSWFRITTFTNIVTMF